MKLRALDLFCGDGGATKGLQRAGFHVTGVDIRPRPRYCGDAFILGDALLQPLAGFDLIWASPPCQAWSRLRALSPDNSYPELIVPMRERLEASGTPWVMENVEEAPLGNSGHLIMLCGTMFGLKTPDGTAELRRHRLFETSFSIPLRPQCQHGRRSSGERGVISVYGDTPRDCRRTTGQVITVTGHTRVSPRKRSISVTGQVAQTNTIRNTERRTFGVKEAGYAMGIDWMTMKGLSQAIPPAYSEFIGRFVLEARA